MTAFSVLSSQSTADFFLLGSKATEVPSASITIGDFAGTSYELVTTCSVTWAFLL
jgi:hypothetical protein